MHLRLVTGTFPQLSETFIYRKAVGLAQRGHQVTVLARARGDLRPFPAALPPTLRIEELPPDTGLRSPSRVARALAALASPRLPEVIAACKRDERTQSDALRHVVRHLPFVRGEADVVHFEFLVSGALYPLVRSLTRRPIVVSCRGSDLHMLEFQPPAMKAAMLACLREADAIHCVSAELAREVQRQTGRTDGVWVNRAAVDVAAIRPRTPSLTGPLRIVSTGRLTWKKGFDYLIAALAHVRRAGVDVHATILGAGELHAPLRFSVEDHGLTVDLPGSVAPAQVLEHLARADAFVLPSLDEGISNAVLEAMASGLAIVTTDVGGMTEAVRHGTDGIVVPPRDPDALADALLSLARDREQCAAFGRHARARAEAEFSLERQLATFEQIYASVVS